MKTKILLIALTVLALFSGCSNNDDNGNSSDALIGRWEAVEEIHTSSEWSHLDYEFEDGEQIVEFTNDRMITYYFGQQESSVQYSYQKGVLTVAGFDMRIEVSSTQLKIYEKSIDVEPIESYTIYKKMN